MPKYIKCPRCELNYILETEDLCPVCKDEVRGIIVNDLAVEEEEGGRICPRCGVNYVAEDQEYCETCRAELDEINAIHDAEDAQWQTEGEGEETVPLDELEDEDAEEADDEVLVLDEDMLAELQSEEEEEEEEDFEEEEEESVDDVDDYDDNVDDYDEDEDLDEVDDDEV